jgi:hypothetical protein
MHKTEQLITILGITKERKGNSIELNCCSLKCWVDRQVANKGHSTNWNAQMTKRQKHQCEDIYSWGKETFLETLNEIKYYILKIKPFILAKDKIGSKIATYF